MGKRSREETAEYLRNWRKNNRDKTRGYTHRQRYGSYSKGSKCEACGSTEKLVVDHDHESNKVRGTLCNSCNLAAGWARDNPLRLLKLIAYLVRTSTADEVLSDD